MKLIRFAFLLMIPLSLLFSCKAPPQASYLQVNADSGRPVSGARPSVADPRIVKGDILYINISSSSIDPRIDMPYNSPAQAAAAQGGGLSPVAGYLVDQRGNILFPRIGSIYVEGMTRLQLSDLLQSKLSKELQNPVADVRFLNFRISVMGEVNKPAQYSIPNARINVLEALALAGDVTIYAKKNSVKVLREVNGSMEEGQIDLTRRDLFTSPYFNLQQNDIVLVYENEKKAKNADQLTARNISIATGIISTLAFLVTVFRR